MLALPRGSTAVGQACASRAALCSLCSGLLSVAQTLPDTPGFAEPAGAFAPALVPGCSMGLTPRVRWGPQRPSLGPLRRTRHRGPGHGICLLPRPTWRPSGQGLRASLRRPEGKWEERELLSPPEGQQDVEDKARGLGHLQGDHHAGVVPHVPCDPVVSPGPGSSPTQVSSPANGDESPVGGREGNGVQQPCSSQLPEPGLGSCLPHTGGHWAGRPRQGCTCRRREGSLGTCRHRGREAAEGYIWSHRNINNFLSTKAKRSRGRRVSRRRFMALGG